MKNKIKILRFA